MLSPGRPRNLPWTMVIVVGHNYIGHNYIGHNYLPWTMVFVIGHKPYAIGYRPQAICLSLQATYAIGNAAYDGQ